MLADEICLSSYSFDLLKFKANNTTITAINKRAKSIKSDRAFILEIGQNNQYILFIGSVMYY